MPAAPSLTVVVPFHDAPSTLERCLAHLEASTIDFELVLVDDASEDAAAIRVARDRDATCVRLDENSGPGVARNAGAARAGGDVVAFVDADVLVEPDTLERLRDVFARDPDVGAAFGAYDDEPADPGLVSTYRNLLHHWVHRTGDAEAQTFWAGCGAVRREVFERAGGFDPAYRVPSIEDIELGTRLAAAGVRIRLDPSIRAKHLKRWNLPGMIFTDVVRRAIPWARLLRERPAIGANDLNLQLSQRVSVVLVFLALLSVPLLALLADARVLPLYLVGGPALGLAGALAHKSGDRTTDRVLVGGALALALLSLGSLAARSTVLVALPAAMILAVVAINRALYGFFLRKRGPGFALGALTLHLLYYVYAGLAYLWVSGEALAGARPRPRPVPGEGDGR